MDKTKVNNVSCDLKVNDIVFVSIVGIEDSAIGIVVSIDETKNSFLMHDVINNDNVRVRVTAENTEIYTVGECKAEKFVMLCEELLDGLKSSIAHITTNKFGIHFCGDIEFKKYDVGIEISQFHQLLNLYSFKYKNNEAEYMKVLIQVMRKIMSRLDNVVDDSIADLEKKLCIV